MVMIRLGSTAGRQFDLAVLHDVRAGRAAGDAEATALALLALLVVAGPATAPSRDDGGRDHGQPVLLVGLAVDPLDRDGVPGCVDDVGYLHGSHTRVAARRRTGRRSSAPGAGGRSRDPGALPHHGPVTALETSYLWPDPVSLLIAVGRRVRVSA